MGYRASSGKAALAGCAGTAMVFVVPLVVLLLWIGTSTVSDPHDQVAIAYFEYGNGARDNLTRLPWETWVGQVGGDGSLQIECKDGTKPLGTYVTGLLSVDATVQRGCNVEYDF